MDREDVVMNNATNLIANDAKSIVQAHLDRLGESKDSHLTEEVKQEKFAQIKAELEKQNAVLVAHYYCDPEVQEWLCFRLIRNGTFWSRPSRKNTCSSWCKIYG